jgi:hypothetical protein
VQQQEGVRALLVTTYECDDASRPVLHTGAAAKRPLRRALVCAWTLGRELEVSQWGRRLAFESNQASAGPVALVRPPNGSLPQ